MSLRTKEELLAEAKRNYLSGYSDTSNMITLALQLNHFAEAQQFLAQGDDPFARPSTFEFLAEHPFKRPEYFSDRDTSKEFYKKLDKNDSDVNYAVVRRDMLQALFAHEGLAQHLDPAKQDWENGRRALHYFALNHELDNLQHCHDAGVNVFTPLHKGENILQASFTYARYQAYQTRPWEMLAWVRKNIAPAALPDFLDHCSYNGERALGLALKLEVDFTTENKMASRNQFIMLVNQLEMDGASLNFNTQHPHRKADSRCPKADPVTLAILAGNENQAIRYVQQKNISGRNDNYDIDNPLVLAINAKMEKLATALLSPEQTTEPHRKEHEKRLHHYLSDTGVGGYTQHYPYHPILQDPLTALAALEDEGMYQRLWALYQQKAEWIIASPEEPAADRLAYDFQKTAIVCNKDRASMQAAINHDRWEQLFWQVSHGASLANEWAGFGFRCEENYRDGMLHIAIRKHNPEIALQIIDLDKAKTPKNSILSQRGQDKLFPAELAAKEQQWDVLLTLLQKPNAEVNNDTAVALLETILRIQNNDDSKATKAQQKITAIYPQLRTALIQNIQDWSDYDLNGSGYNNDKPRALNLAVELGDHILVDAFLDKGAKANYQAFSIAAQCLGRKNMTPDVIEIENQRGLILQKITDHMLADIEKAGGIKGYNPKLEAAVVHLVWNAGRIDIADQLLDAGLSPHAEIKELNLNLLHVAIVAADRNSDNPEAQQQCDQFITKLLTRSQQTGHVSAHAKLVNDGGFFNELSATLASYAIVGYASCADGSSTTMGQGAGYTPLSLTIMSQTINLDIVQQLYQHGADFASLKPALTKKLFEAIQQADRWDDFRDLNISKDITQQFNAATTSTKQLPPSPSQPRRNLSM
ncbi:MAG: hypothetical protein ACOYK8_03795 [Alphaproteobacteria bacterium]